MCFVDFHTLGVTRWTWSRIVRPCGRHLLGIALRCVRASPERAFQNVPSLLRN